MPLTITSVLSNFKNLKIDIEENHIMQTEQLNSTIHDLGDDAKIDLIDMKDKVAVQIDQSRKF